MKTPKLPADIQVERLKARNVSFAYMTEREAIRYLETNHSYYKLRSFCRPFVRRRDGAYVDLDFGCLRDLYIVDMRLRKCLLSMCLDVDHYARMLLMKAFDLSLEDGYEIIADFEAENGAAVRAAYQAAEHDPYCGPLYVKDAGCMPVWTFVEIIPFPLFVRFFDFFAWHVHDCALIDESFRLKTIAQLRDALENDRPLLCDLSPGTAEHSANHSVLRALGKAGVSKSCHRRKMGCENLRRIVTLLYTYNLLAPLSDLRGEQEEALGMLARRLTRNLHFYERVPLVHSTLAFLARVIDSWFPERYTF